MAMFSRASFRLARNKYCFSCLQTLKSVKVKEAGTSFKEAVGCHLHSSCHHDQHVTLPCSQQQTVEGEAAKPWKLSSAVCVERFPVVSEEMNSIEQSYFNMVNAMELEKSALSQHELSVAADRRRMARKQAGDQEDEEDGEGGDLMTALDLEDLATEELSRFQTGLRKTDADKEDDRKSLNRHLSDKLVLLVKCKVGNESSWMFPHGLRQEEETMKNVAQRTLFEHSSTEGSLHVHFMGNAPVGFYKQRYPRSVQEETGSSGVKMFFFKAQHVSGEFKVLGDSSAVEDYVWVTRDELGQYLDESYLDSVQKFILPV